MTTYDVTDFGATGDGVTDDGPAIQAALDAAVDGGTVVFPGKRDYRVNTFLVVRGGTTIHAYGARIFSGWPTRGVLRNFEGTDSFAGYSGHSNITVLGGVWDGNAYKASDGTGVVTGTTNVMCFIHAENITVRDVTVRDCSGAHGLEFNAVRYARVEHCRFEGFVDNTVEQNRASSEAVQFDIAKTGSSSIGLFDNTCCEDISVSECWFGPSVRLGPYGRAVGSHSMAEGKWYTRMSVRGCEVHGGAAEGVLATAWRDSEIQGNKFTGTDAYFVKADRSVRLQINGNQAYAHGVLGVDCDQLQVNNNIIRSSVTNAINLTGQIHGVVAGNLIEGTGQWHGVSIAPSASRPGHGVLVANNVIHGVASAGVRVSADDVTVKGNLVRESPMGVNVSGARAALIGNDLRDVTTATISVADTVMTANLT